MPGTAKDKVAAANARAADVGSSKQMGAAASSFQELVDGKKKKSNITSRIRKFFTPRTRANSKSVNENESNQSMNPNGDVGQVNQNEREGSLSQSRLLSASHECVFSDDQISPVKLMPAHHKSMEAVSGNFAADLNKKMQLGRPPAKKSAAKDNEQPKEDNRIVATGESSAVEQAFFEPWAASSSKSDDADIIRHLGSLDTVGSGVGSLATVSQKSRRDIRQKNRRPVTVIGGQKLRSKPDAVLVMPDLLTEESDADDVGGASEPASISSNTVSQHAMTAAVAVDSKSHRFQKKGDVRRDMSPMEGGSPHISLAQTADQSDGAVRSATPLAAAFMGSLSPSDDVYGDKHLLAGKEQQKQTLQALAVDVSAQHYSANISHSPSGHLLSPTIEKSPSSGQVSPNIKSAEGHVSIISTSASAADAYLASESSRIEQAVLSKPHDEQHGKGAKPPVTKPRPLIMAAKSSPAENLSPAGATVSDTKITLPSLLPKGGVRVFPAVLPANLPAAVDSHHSPAEAIIVERGVSVESNSTISIPRAALTKHSLSTPVSTGSERDSGRLADDNQTTNVSDGFGISIPRPKLHSRSNVVADSDSSSSSGNSNKEPSTTVVVVSEASLKPSNLQHAKKEGVTQVYAIDDDSSKESGVPGEDTLTSLRHLPAIADQGGSSSLHADEAAKRKSMVVLPTVSLAASDLAAVQNKRLSYHGGAVEEVFQGGDQGKAGDEFSQAFKKIQLNKEAKYVTAIDTSTAAVSVAVDSAVKLQTGDGHDGNNENTKNQLGKHDIHVELAETNSRSHNSEQLHGSGNHEMSAVHKLRKTSIRNESALEHKSTESQATHKVDEHVTRVHVYDKKPSSDSSKIVISSKSIDKENESGVTTDNTATKPSKTGLPPKPSGIRGSTLGQTWSPGDLGGGISKVKDLTSTTVVKDMPPVLRKISVPSKEDVNNTVDVKTLSAAAKTAASDDAVTSGADHSASSEKANKFLVGKRGGSLKQSSGGGGPNNREKNEAPATTSGNHAESQSGKSDKGAAAAKPFVGNAASMKRSEAAAAAKALEKMSSVDSPMMMTSSEAMDKKKDAEDAMSETEKATEERVSNARTMFGERSKSTVAKGGSLRRVEGSVVAKILDESPAAYQSQAQSAKKEEPIITTVRAQSMPATITSTGATESKKKEQESAVIKTEIEAAKSSELTSRSSFGERNKPLLLKGGSLRKVEGSVMAKELASAELTELKEESSEHATKQQVSDAKNGATSSAKLDTEPKKTDVDQPAITATIGSTTVTPSRAFSLGSRTSLKRSDGSGVVKALDSMSSGVGDKGGAGAAEKDKETVGTAKIAGRADSMKTSEQSSEPTWMAAARSKTANWNKHGGLGQPAPGEENSASPDVTSTGSATVAIGQAT